MSETQSIDTNSGITVEEIAAERVSSYEQLRDGVEDQDVRVSWRDGDRWAGYARTTYDKLAADEDLSEQGKVDRAERAYNLALDRAEKGYEAARARAQKLAKDNEAKGIPMPDGRTLFANKVKDASELVAVQNETMAVLSKVERIKASLPKGMRGGSPTTSVLRETYTEAMEVGGIEGSVRARATLNAADALGVPWDDVIAPHMEPKHYEALDNARRYQLIEKNIPTAHSVVAKVPFKVSGTSSRDSNFHSGSSTPKLFTSTRKTLQPPNRRLKSGNPFRKG